MAGAFAVPVLQAIHLSTLGTVLTLLECSVLLLNTNKINHQSKIYFVKFHPYGICVTVVQILCCVMVYFRS